MYILILVYLCISFKDLLGVHVKSVFRAGNGPPTLYPQTGEGGAHKPSAVAVVIEPSLIEKQRKDKKRKRQKMWELSWVWSWPIFKTKGLNYSPIRIQAKEANTWDKLALTTQFHKHHQWPIHFPKYHIFFFFWSLTPKREFRPNPKASSSVCPIGMPCLCPLFNYIIVPFGPFCTFYSFISYIICNSACCHLFARFW